MKQQKNQNALLDAYGRIPDRMIEESIAYTPRRSARPLRRAFVTVLAATLCLALVTVTVMAAVPDLRRYLNLGFVSESTRHESVPEGWVGVYTVEDLNRIRDDLDGKYMLMNDLTFPEDAPPFTPIGTEEAPFIGQFDGNGHVIRGLVIDVTCPNPQLCYMVDYVLYTPDAFDSIKDVIASGETHIVNGTLRTGPVLNFDQTERIYVGLFGYCGEDWGIMDDVIDHGNGYYEYYSPVYEALDTTYGGLIKNLGVEQATVRVSNAMMTDVGVIAGNATYMTACYTKDCVVEVTGFDNEDGVAIGAEASYWLHSLVRANDGRILVGGLAGRSALLDSCFAAGNTVTLAEMENVPAYVGDGNSLSYAGNLSGHTFTAVTSYAEDCTLSVPQETLTFTTTGEDEQEEIRSFDKFGVGELCGHISVIPHLMTEEQFHILTQRLLQRYGGDEDNFYFKQFCSYFAYRNLSQLTGNSYYYNPTFFIGEFDPTRTVCIFDPAATFVEELKIEKAILSVMSAEEAFEMCASENIKVGMLGCHVTDGGQSYREDDFPEFNFHSIWVMEEGRPVLRIFQ